MSVTLRERVRARSRTRAHTHTHCARSHRKRAVLLYRVCLRQQNVVGAHSLWLGPIHSLSLGFGLHLLHSLARAFASLGLSLAIGLSERPQATELAGERRRAPDRRFRWPAHATRRIRRTHHADQPSEDERNARRRGDTFEAYNARVQHSHTRTHTHARHVHHIPTPSRTHCAAAAATVVVVSSRTHTHTHSLAHAHKSAAPPVATAAAAAVVASRSRRRRVIES